MPIMGRIAAPIVARRADPDIYGRTADYDWAWQKLGARFMRRNPFCRFCEQLDPGGTALAGSVDHIVPVSEAPELRLEWLNLQSLCNRCHYRTKRDLEREAARLGMVLMLPIWCERVEDRFIVLERLGREKR